MRSVTFVVKTFERPHCLKRLIESIKKYYPEVPILVADDSKEETQYEGVKYYKLPFDSGLSAGRNFLLKRVHTKYFLLLDDDFIFTEETKIEKLLDVARSGFDIVGGQVRGLDYHGILELEDGVLRYIRGDRGQHMGYPLYDLVLNFFIGRTKEIRNIGWDDELKLAEHSAFFIKAKGKLKITYVSDVIVEHMPDKQTNYAEYRKRGNIFFQMYMRKAGIREVVDFNGNITLQKKIVDHIDEFFKKRI